MSGWRLTLKQPPALRVDLRGVTPGTLAALSAAQIEQLPVGYGNHNQALGEWFQVSATTNEHTLHFVGDLARFDRVGWQMDQGRIVVDGSVGHYAGGCMRGGELRVNGHAALQAACEMTGGSLSITGNVGDFAASTLPGSMDGMRGGTFIVKGHAGARFADRMRRGTAVVCGNAGDFLASRLVAGTVVLGGSCGAHAAYGMRRGTVVFAGAAPALGSSFVPAQANADVMWQLLARDLAQQLAGHGEMFAGLHKRRITRALGDLSVAGKGELIFPS
jgi:formylmethanofuran dehydrogenase subunit C